MVSAEEIIKNSLNIIETMVEQGKTDKQIAEKIGIGYSTYRRYKSSNSSLKEVISQGKDKKNQSVEQALFNNAIGYHYTEEVATKVKYETITEDGTVLSKEDVKISKVRKYKHPDLLAEKYWLNNKDKLHWKDDPYKVSNDKKLTKLKEKEVNSKVIEI
ncbi:Xaa-His dipeptidase [Clostridium botulinum]|uniref:Xaa-His dipeptidase n=1 Tax=Clostridium botulinum TaxID=1491 RepID=UPI000463E6FF|nr:Xaa-His dipeptidase [Clostridium botulinum]APH21378.1 putative xaa-His dipeptidase [Clostridium botulinum]APQ70494.1 putative xaa-His dipeptidase [Clostridium botulinum]MBN3380908.1 Xaa-His dipeptidase [Clostridium botulinum]MBY6923957.1 Xaa-His dipeptidase [Clostridium botulinum]MCR1164617.1 Xaa-His dipeptidase [Clostridium botulinum]